MNRTTKMKKYPPSIWMIAIFTCLLIGCSRDSSGPLDLKLDVGAHSLHLVCVGQGSPTVVLDTGSGETYESWQSIIDGIAKETRVCAYDRAGYGQSEPGPLPRDSGRETEELALLLNKAGIKGPYILVGHSLGGLNMQVFAGKYPDQVAGMLLLDPPPLEWLSGGSFPELREMFLQQAEALQSQSAAARSSKDPQARTQANFLAMVASEMTEMFTGSIQQAVGIKSFGDIPLTVIASTQVNPNFGDSAQAYQSFWIEQSKELAKKSTRGKFLLAKGSSHHIHRDAPQLVLDALREMIQK
ncbi:MAG: putative hydrolase or acyltransferase of alpha/beta superfamily [Chloroflexi bacterium]|nr:putative hydrolase or acyltransferase of alpha/beta superfamily [Chloroflexota bacterium]